MGCPGIQLQVKNLETQKQLMKLWHSQHNTEPGLPSPWQKVWEHWQSGTLDSWWKFSSKWSKSYQFQNYYFSNIFSEKKIWTFCKEIFLVIWGDSCREHPAFSYYHHSAIYALVPHLFGTKALFYPTGIVLLWAYTHIALWSSLVRQDCNARATTDHIW